jgi:hypothetical protein
VRKNVLRRKRASLVEWLLPDTKPPEYQIELFFVGDFARGNTPLDLNLHYETVIDHGGSDNYVSLGLSFYSHFGKRDNKSYFYRLV